MSPPAVALAATSAALLAAALLLGRQRRLLRERLAAATAATQELESLQRAFGRFAPAEVVEQIIQRGVATGAEKKEVTVLFADLKGFTSMSDGMDPAVLLELLNGYFREMSRAITASRGHVGKFIGDGIMALFGALEPNPWQCSDAVRAAIAMRAALARYNESLAAAGRPTLSLGIGVHRGIVVAGVIGSEELLEYSVIGSAVNLAARVEGLTRLHDADILVTEEVRSRLDERFDLRELPAAVVKGVREPVRTWEVLGIREKA